MHRLIEWLEKNRNAEVSLASGHRLRWKFLRESKVAVRAQRVRMAAWGAFCAMAWLSCLSWATSEDQDWELIETPFSERDQWLAERVPSLSASLGLTAPEQDYRLPETISLPDALQMGEELRLPVREPPQEDLPLASPLPRPTEPDQIFVTTPWQVPVGYSGSSGVLPDDCQIDDHFIPVVDRWRGGYPRWDRYGPDHSVFSGGDPFEEDAPYARGAWYNPYRQNLLKGDYPIYGQHTFVNVSATAFYSFEFRQVPTATTPFESTEDPFEEQFFGNPDQFAIKNDYRFSIDLIHGDAGFKPADWRIRLSPVLNLNYLDVEELGIVNPDVRDGTTRYRNFITLEEAFIETKLADTSPYYDFISLRTGSQLFSSDFRGFIFADINLAARLFGTRNANRDQFNIALFDQLEKETNSELNQLQNRPQNIFIANYYRQDFIWPGFTTELSVHYNQDNGEGLVFDSNDFLVRPDPVGIFTPHRVDAVYLGWTGDGHINRFNVNSALYLVFGHDSLNPLAGQPVDISAQMAALELSYDRDWIRFRTSGFYASGDDDIFDDEATGFDTVLDNPNFAGGMFSYWNRQAIRLNGVNLVDRFSLVPHLRSSKIQGQANFVNPGLFLANFGFDVELTPRARLINNLNMLYFNHTEVLEQFTFQADIARHIGTDISSGVEYRPLLNDNLIVLGGVSGLVPGSGFKDLYGDFPDQDVNNLFAGFIEVAAVY